MKKFYQTYEVMKSSPEYSNSDLWLLTLKLPPHHVLETREKVDFINAALRKFLNYRLPKNTTQSDKNLKGKSFKDLDIEYSKFLHVGFDNSLPFATVHLHIVLFTRPSFNGNNRVTDLMMFKRWEKATGSPDCYLHKDKIKDTQQDAVDVMAYGLQTLKVESAKKHPTKFLQLIDELERKHSFSHTAGLRKIRAEINMQYKQSVKVKKKANEE